MSGNLPLHPVDQLSATSYVLSSFPFKATFHHAGVDVPRAVIRAWERELWVIVKRVKQAEKRADEREWYAANRKSWRKAG